MKDCSPVGSRTFGWGMFPNDAKAACSALCLVASSIKLCLLSPQKSIKKPLCEWLLLHRCCPTRTRT